MRLAKALKVRESLANELFRIWETTHKRMLSHDEYLALRSAFYATDGYRSAPVWVKTYLEGLEWGMMQTVWRQHVVFSYVHNGKRLTLDSAEYRAVSVHDIDVTTGQYVWRQDTGKLWTTDKRAA